MYIQRRYYGFLSWVCVKKNEFQIDVKYVVRVTFYIS